MTSSKLEGIINALHTTTGELKAVVTRLDTEMRKRVAANLDELADKAKEEIREKLLALLAKLNK
jgi:phage host-nuclease inhibitor protein Gam